MSEQTDDCQGPRVRIATKTSDDYCKYQLKNHPNTTDFGLTVVMGCPFPDAFTQGLAQLRDGLIGLFSKFPNVTLHAYRDYHFHATACPAVRTPFCKEVYERNREEMNCRQKVVIEARQLSYESIQRIVQPILAFDISIIPADIELNKRGEILLWGKAANQEDRGQLKTLKRSLVEAGLDGTSTNSKIHITLATVEGFHRLVDSEKKRMKEKMITLLRETTLRTTHIDQVKWVYYGHRSLHHIVCSRVLELGNEATTN